ncbi:peptidylprolyl isomerase [Prochlorothrix hollandica]|uniref:peptidylprolyl isomerase n=1 Tax=Prochlorothrix hollandica TaxID=1223 RepID=UPI003341E2EA
MTFDLHIGDQCITATSVMPLLARYQLIPKLAQEVILETAIAPVPCTPEETQAAVQQFCEQNKLANPEQGRAWLTQQAMDPNELENLATKGLKLQRFKEQNFGNKLESYFLQRKSALDQVVYSLIRSKDVGIAQEVYFRIEDHPDEMTALARQYSEGPESQTGGLIGPQELSTPHPVLARLLSISQPGQLWPPTRVGEWMIIVRLEKFIPAQLDETIQQRLMGDLFSQWLQEQMKGVKLVPASSSPSTV